jgi:nucleoside phosphorylase
MKTIAIIIFLGVFGAARGDDIAFFFALDSDLQTLRSNALSTTPGWRAGTRTISILTVGAHHVYAVKMGSGSLESALGAQALLSRVRCDRAFSIGPAGALADTITPGEWRRIDTVINVQKGSTGRNGFELSPLARVSLATNLGPGINLPALFSKEPAGVTLASGEMFVASDAFRGELRQRTGAEAIDMNLAGVAAVCADHRVPLHAWRIFSDRAGDSASEDFRNFATAYNGAGGQAIAEVIRRLPADPRSPAAYPNLDKLLSK